MIKKYINILLNSFIFRIVPDKIYLKIKFKIKLNKKLNLEQPQTFSEKLQWLKLYDRKKEYTNMVDKFEVKNYVRDLIGEEYIIPTLAVYDKFEDIEWKKLPNQFVIKCTHDSGGLVICKDKSKLDIKSAKRKINKCLHRNFYYLGREWAYKKVKPRIIIEKYMEDKHEPDLRDYKFMSFNGKVKCSFVCTERRSKEGLKVTFFDLDWNKMPFERRYPMSKKDIKKPLNYEQMIKLAEKLSKNIPFVRVDFYEVDGKIYFGELTFYPGAGFEDFRPEEYDYLLGSWIKLPQEKRGDNEK